MVIKRSDLVKWSIIFMPFIDILNGFMMKVLGIEGFGIIVHLIILVLMVSIIIKKGNLSRRNTYILFVAIYFIAQTIITNMLYGLSYLNSISYVIKYLYFFAMLATLDKLRDDVRLWKRIRSFYTWIYPFGIIMSRLIGFNFSTYGSGEGFLGFMYSQNSYTFVLIVVLYWSLEYMLIHFKILNLVRVIISLETILLIGSKSGYIFALLVSAYLFVKSLKTRSVNKIIRGITTVLYVIVIVFVVFTVFSDEISKIFIRIKYFASYYGYDSLTAILYFLTSDRWSRLAYYYPFLTKSLGTILFGLGYGFFKTQVTTEMDIFNLIFIFGIIGFILYLYAFYKVSRIKHHNSYRVLIIMLFVYLFFGGHVLADVMANGIFAIVIVMGQK